MPQLILNIDIATERVFNAQDRKIYRNSVIKRTLNQLSLIIAII